MRSGESKRIIPARTGDPTSPNAHNGRLTVSVEKYRKVTGELSNGKGGARVENNYDDDEYDDDKDDYDNKDINETINNSNRN